MNKKQNALEQQTTNWQSKLTVFFEIVERVMNFTKRDKEQSSILTKEKNAAFSRRMIVIFSIAALVCIFVAPDWSVRVGAGAALWGCFRVFTKTLRN